MKVTTLGTDLAKSIFQWHGVDEHGKVVVQKRVPRSKLRETIAQLPACGMGREAGASAQYCAGVSAVGPHRETHQPSVR